MKNYGWDAVKLADAYGLKELAELRERVVTDPASACPQYAAGKSLYPLTAKARKRLQAIAWAVTYVIRESRTRDAMLAAAQENAP